MRGASRASGANQRRAPRFRHLRFASYQTDTARGDGHLAVISALGMFVRCDQLPQIGEAVAISLESTSTPLATGHVRSVDTGPERRGFGLEIEEASEDYREMVRRVERRQRRPR